MALLDIDNLVTEIESDGRHFPVVDGVSLEIGAGEILGLVGESGCGKSMTALSIMQLLPRPAGRIRSGSVRFDGRELTTLSVPEMAAVRGDQISMIFQDPMTALNPVHRVGAQIEEMLELHDASLKTPAARRQRVVDLLGQVGIPAPAERRLAYPHQLSGGMRQRVVIAIALACKPKLLIADEPTTALDVTIQAQIVALIREQQARSGMAVLFITHDLGLVAQTCQRVAVMYAGKVVETAPVQEIFRQPRHPYTRALIDSLPSALHAPKSRLNTVAGMVPQPDAMPSGCRFANRCPYAQDRCREVDPPLEVCGEQRRVACIRWKELTL